MGLPAENPAGYRRSSVVEHADEIQGRLLLIHGMIDENVHFRHSVRLIDVLNHARVDFDLVVLPDERHMPRDLSNRLCLEEKILRFLHRELL